LYSLSLQSPLVSWHHHQDWWMPARALSVVAKLGVEGRGFGQAEGQANGEGDCFKRVASSVDVGKPSSNTNLLVSRPSP
jgi:hypothetical protein